MTKSDDVDPPDGAGMIVLLGEDLFVYGGPCLWPSTNPEMPDTTVEEVISALSTQASRDASVVVEITVGGYPGKSITLHVPDEVASNWCDLGDVGSWGSATDATSALLPGPGPDRRGTGPGLEWRAYVQLPKRPGVGPLARLPPRDLIVSTTFG